MAVTSRAEFAHWAREHCSPRLRWCGRCSARASFAACKADDVFEMPVDAAWHRAELRPLTRTASMPHTKFAAKARGHSRVAGFLRLDRCSTRVMDRTIRSRIDKQPPNLCHSCIRHRVGPSVTHHRSPWPSGRSV